MWAPEAILQATLQGILQGAGPVSYYLSAKAYFVTGSSFLDPCFLGVAKALPGRFDPRFWVFPGHFDPGSWILDFGRFLGVLILVPRRFLRRLVPS